MKKLSYLAFCLVLVAGFGCAITDYPTITDNSQSNSGDDGIVNTAGKAHLFESSQIATIWPDGTDELFSQIDQKADGTATITTYNNFSTGVDPTFHSDLYCNADWTGCAIWTAPDANDGNLFDGKWNSDCAGSRSLSLLLSLGTRYGECGAREARFSVQEKISLIDSAVSVKAGNMSGLQWNMNGQNTSVSLRNLETGLSYNMPLFGSRIEHFFNNAGNEAITWLDHAMVGVALNNAASMFRNQLNSEGVELTLTHNGVSTSFTVAGGEFTANALAYRSRTSY